MSSTLLRSTYRRMVKYFLRHWCIEMKMTHSTRRTPVAKNDQKKEQTVDEEIADPELEWEHEQGIERSPSTHRQMISEEILRMFSTDTSPSSIDLDEFEWDDFFDLVL